MKLKKIFIVMLLGVFSVSAFGQDDAISKFFDKYMEDENFTMVYISPKVFDMISTISEDNADSGDAKEVSELLKDLKGIRILTTEVNPQAYYKEATDKLQLNDYEVLMQVRDKKENVRFLVKDDGPVVSELLLLVGGSDSFVLMSFAGKIDLKKISKLAKSLNIEGAEHLKELDEE